MDILKKELAPLSAKAWEEIEERAAQVIKTNLTGRKAVRVSGPLGWKYTVVPSGRLALVDETGDVKVGQFTAKPLVEARVQFSLNRWELDNVNRGAKDIDFSALEDALTKLTEFEDRAVYDGYAKGDIVGLAQSSSNAPIGFGKDAQSVMEALSKAVVVLNANHASGPFSLVVGTKAWVLMNKEIHGISLIERVERFLGAKVIHSMVLEGALLVPFDDENLELTVGQDYAVGYESHDSREVRLFATESFTFRVLDPSLIVRFTL